MKVVITYSWILEPDGEQRTLGGVQTYVLQLGELIRDMGWEPLILQGASKPFTHELDGLPIEGVPIAGLKSKQFKQRLYEEAMKRIDPSKDIIIFGADQWGTKTDYPRAISIQHGIGFDLPVRFFAHRDFFRVKGIDFLYKKWILARQIQFFRNAPNRVCVDHNFLNWYKTTITGDPEGHIWVIPNFTPSIATNGQVSEKLKRKGPMRIIFARRFTEHRGTELMIEAARQLLEEYKDIQFAFAGEGPLEDTIRESFKGDSRVTVTKYEPKDTLDVHLDYDISVVPSLGSEGTSISVAEAMGAGCAVVATNIGGVTNMIIDGFNGSLVMPEANDLVQKLRLLIEDTALRKRMARNGFETAKQAFNLKTWRDRWQDVLTKVANGS